MRNAIEAFEEAAELERLALGTSLPAAPVPLWGDSARLQQITGNLISNALNYPAGGRVSVRLSVEREQAVLEIEDTGEGIAAEDLPVIFEVFRQGRETHVGGLGIGLDLVGRLTELHGGSVRVESDGVGRGARFRVARWPRLAVGARQTVHEPGARPPGRLGQRSVLVVEDDDDTRAVLRYMLETEGATVEAARNGGEGVRRPSGCTPRSSCATSACPTSTAWKWRDGCAPPPHWAGCVSSR